MSGGLRQWLIAAGYHSRPAFLIVGAQKAGTSALYEYLSHHPQVVPASTKEIGFFSPEAFDLWPAHGGHAVCRGLAPAFARSPIYRRAARWYHGHFPLPHDLRRSITGEATPEYLYAPLAAERIARYNPSMRIIALVRDPVSRAFSAWNMFRRFDEGAYRPLKEHRPFDEAVDEELSALGTQDTWEGTDYVRRGLYEEQLARYYRHFPAKQILVLDSRDLRDRTQEVLDRVLTFLGLPALPEHGPWPRVLEGRYETAMSANTRERLRAFYRPHNARLFKLLARDLTWD